MSLAKTKGAFDWNRFTTAAAITVFVRALGAARSGDPARARQDIDRLQALRDALTAAKQGYWAEQVDIQRRVASAWAARAEGKNQEALQLLRAAADAEDLTEKHPVTPGPIVPARELLGEMLLELNQPALALKELEASIAKEPNRFKGLYGAAKAAALSGEQEKARALYEKLLALCSHADTARPELGGAKTFLAKK